MDARHVAGRRALRAKPVSDHDRNAVAAGVAHARERAVRRAPDGVHAAVEEVGLRPRAMVGELGAEPLPERRTESILEVEVSPLDMDSWCVDSGGEVGSIHAQPGDDLRDGGPDAVRLHAQPRDDG